MQWFKTDKFLSQLKRDLDALAKDFQGEMINDGIINAEKLIHDHEFINNDSNLVKYMIEIGRSAEMASNLDHDCKMLYAEFDRRFRDDHGEGKHSATALEAMKIITIIGNDIDSIAPHISYLFESDSNFFPDIFNDSFVTTFEIPAE